MGFGDFLKKTTLDPFNLTGLRDDDDESNLAGFKLPDFKVDPVFEETQGALKDVGLNILKGDIPDFLRPITTAGSPQFQGMLDRVKSDVMGSTLEAAALRGRGRGGGVIGDVAESVANTSAQLSFADYQRSLDGLRNVFNAGVGITEGARGAGFQNQGMENTFNLKRAGMDLKFRSMLDAQEMQEGALLGGGLGNLSQIFTGGMGAAGGAGGSGGGMGSQIGSGAGAALAAAFGLPPQLGAMVGGQLGGAFDKKKGSINEEELPSDLTFENFQLSGSIA